MKAVADSSEAYPKAGIDASGRAVDTSRVTYEEATRWLREIGGTTVLAEEQKRGRGRITVIAENAKGRTVSRHVLFDDTLTGLERERAVREAFTRACDELMRALAG